jgi:integrase
MGTLRPHTKQNGETVYYYRATLPVRENGVVVQKRCEISTGAHRKNEAWKIAREIEAKFHEAAKIDPDKEGLATTFAEAAMLYLEGGGSTRFLEPVIKAIGNMPLADVTQVAVQQVVRDLYPKAKVQTVNRQVYTPILAVLNYAASVDLCPKPLIKRPKGHAKTQRVDAPDESWFPAVLPYLKRRHRALVLLLTLHGLRIGEALARTPNDIDTRDWTLHIPDTKTGEPAVITLAPPVIDAIRAIPNWREQKWLFGTCHDGGPRKALKAACAKAGVRYYGFHALGRHAFAMRAVRNGHSIKWLMQAGRWKTSAMPMKQYGHFERSEIDRDVRNLSEKVAATFKLSD